MRARAYSKKGATRRSVRSQRGHPFLNKNCLRARAYSCVLKNIVPYAPIERVSDARILYAGDADIRALRCHNSGKIVLFGWGGIKNNEKNVFQKTAIKPPKVVSYGF